MWVQFPSSAEEMTEWLKVIDCKSVKSNLFVGSNPTLWSINKNIKYKILKYNMLKKLWKYL